MQFHEAGEKAVSQRSSNCTLGKHIPRFASFACQHGFPTFLFFFVCVFCMEKRFSLFFLFLFFVCVLCLATQFSYFLCFVCLFVFFACQLDFLVVYFLILLFCLCNPHRTAGFYPLDQSLCVPDLGYCLRCCFCRQIILLRFSISFSDFQQDIQDHRTLNENLNHCTAFERAIRRMPRNKLISCFK